MTPAYTMNENTYRSKIETYILQNARPVDKYSHQPRLYQLACHLAATDNLQYDDDILHAAAWLHDLGVFIGHRPEDLTALKTWDHIGYVERTVPDLLTNWQFPEAKINAVIEAIKDHMPQSRPRTTEAVLLHDADVLEQLGGVGIARAFAKVGRDTRYQTYGDVIPVIEKALQLSDYVTLNSAKKIAAEKTDLLNRFLDALKNELMGISF